MFRKIIERSKTQIIHTALLTFFVAPTFNVFFFAKNTEALRVPALAVSFSSTPRINGTAIINSTTQTAEYLVAVTVYSDNLTGYQATISTEDNETAMTSVTNTDRIESISQNTPLANFPTNTWGIRLGDYGDFVPIPSASTPMTLALLGSKSVTNTDFYQANVGLKLASNLTRVANTPIVLWFP